ncbi:alpha/beta fold hydrolase [Microbacterium sp. X-17]|uniref:alpha/beta hydrolase n=1 Tax=Microbacterium sp. X-17 TaxID=3144404 RepID=UPI0031F52124
MTLFAENWTRPAAVDDSQEPLVIKEQGSFAFAGSVVERSDGSTVHVDTGYVRYQIPVNAKKHAIVMWHGYGQTGRTWETTPDGREGYDSIFLRRGYPVFIVDQPRRGRAGTSSVGTTIASADDEGAFFFTDQNVFESFRLGTWAPGGEPVYNEGAAFPQTPGALKQYLSQVTASTGPDGFEPETIELFSDAIAGLIDDIGPSILLIHSTAGAYGYRAAIKSSEIRGLVAYETSPFAFPESMPPAELAFDIPELANWVDPDFVPDADFDRLTQIPVQVVFGDYTKGHFEAEAEHQRAAQFIETLQARGGDAELLNLTERGLTGNTHFAFSDRNSLQIADLLSEWLDAHGFGD